MNEEVTKYIGQAEENQRQIMTYLRSLIHSVVPDVKEEFKWSRPVFRSKHDFAYFKTTKKHLSLGFFQSERLHDPMKLLEGSGKNMCHVKLHSINNIDENTLKEWILASAK